ncbi:MAG: hypothetical protein P8Y28_05240 [Gammaproteobacteria bacterium]|jgi:hypothetical protein
MFNVDRTIFLFITLLMIFPLYSFAGNTAVTNGYESLQSQYQSIKGSLESNQYGAPVFIQSDFQEDNASGEVFALIEHEFNEVAAGLSSADYWCDVVLLHINVKGCDVKFNDDSESNMTLYVGRRYFQTPDQAHEMQYRFNKVSSSPNYLHVNLTAGDGPLGTSDYLLTFEAIPFNESTSFIHFKYSYRYGFMAKLALDGYLATIGRHKVGFTITEYDDSNNPIFVKGLQGIVERNSMRYFLAIRSFLDTSTLRREQWDTRVQHWYRLARRFERQFIEVREKEYVETKRKEFSTRETTNTALLRMN